MKTLHFETTIDAPRRKVWETMLEPDTYQKWTTDFMEGSYYEGSWEKGEEIRFLAPDNSGMMSVIEENRPHEFLSIRHLGIIKDGVEDTESPEARNWAPAHENYTLSDSGGSTKVQIDIDVTPEHEQMMTETWPKALETLKKISEGRAV